MSFQRPFFWAIAIHCVALFFAKAANAQDVVTLEQATAVALEHQYGILLARNDSASAAIDYRLRNAALLPALTFNSGTVWNNNNQRQKFSDGTERERDGVKSNNLTASLNLNWTLFDGLKMFVTRDKAAEFLRLGELAVKTQVVNTVSEISRQYYGIVRQKQQLRAIEEQMSISEERVKLADKKLNIGLGSKPELLQARVDLNAQKASKLKQETLIVQLKESLNLLTGRQLPQNFETTDSIEINTALELQALQSSIPFTNPTYLTAKKNIELASLTLRERKAERWPTLSLNTAYNLARTDNATVVNPFQPLFSQNQGLNFGLNLSMPILNHFLTNRNIQQADLDIRYQQLVYERERQQIDVALVNAFSDYQYQQQALALEEENIGLARENVQIALERFRQGVSTFLELREAQKSLEDAYNRLIAARYNTKLAETELLRLKGDLVR
jgi:outer membrane protein TolC